MSSIILLATYFSFYLTKFECDINEESHATFQFMLILLLNEKSVPSINNDVE